MYSQESMKDYEVFEAIDKEKFFKELEMFAEKRDFVLKDRGRFIILYKGLLYEKRRVLIYIIPSHRTGFNESRGGGLGTEKLCVE